MQAAILAFILAVIACPLSLLIYLFINILFNRFIHVSKLKASHLNTYFSLALIAIGIILHQHISTLDLLRYLGARLSIIGARFTDGDYSLSDYLLSNPFTIGICLLILTLAGKLAFFTTERQLLWSEERFQKRKMSKLFNSNPDFVPTRSTLIFGVSGAGKSAYIARMVEDTVAKQHEPFIAVVDGKGSTEEFSLYYSARIIAKKHGLTLRIINGTANDSLGGTVYDFLDGITVPNQAKDMIMSLIEDDTIQESSGSEHYRIMTEAYMEKIITFMMRNEIKVTLSNVVNMMKPDYFNDVCNQMKIPAEDTITIKNYMKQNWKDVQASVTKLELFLGDQGRKIFTNPDGKETTNLRKAYQNREMVLVLADEMSMPQLAQGLVKILAMDLRNLTAMRLTEKMDMDRKIYATFDEFTSYISALPILRSMFARARLFTERGNQCELFVDGAVHNEFVK